MQQRMTVTICWLQYAAKDDDFLFEKNNPDRHIYMYMYIIIYNGIVYVCTCMHLQILLCSTRKERGSNVLDTMTMWYLSLLASTMQVAISVSPSLSTSLLAQSRYYIYVRIYIYIYVYIYIIYNYVHVLYVTIAQSWNIHLYMYM